MWRRRRQGERQSRRLAHDDAMYNPEISSFATKTSQKDWHNDKTVQMASKGLVENQREETDNMTLKDLLLDFFGSRFSAHAIPHVANRRSLARRLVWALISIVFVGLLIWQIVKVLQDFYSYPKQVSIEMIEKSEVLFPSVTVCNFNVMKLSEVKNSEFYSSLAAQETFADKGDCSGYEETAPWVTDKDYKPFSADEYWAINEIPDVVKEPETTTEMPWTETISQWTETAPSSSSSSKPSVSDSTSSPSSSSSTTISTSLGSSTTTNPRSTSSSTASSTSSSDASTSSSIATSTSSSSAASTSSTNSISTPSTSSVSTSSTNSVSTSSTSSVSTSSTSSVSTSSTSPVSTSSTSSVSTSSTSSVSTSSASSVSTSSTSSVSTSSTSADSTSSTNSISTSTTSSVSTSSTSTDSTSSTNTESTSSIGTTDSTSTSEGSTTATSSTESTSTTSSTTEATGGTAKRKKREAQTSVEDTDESTGDDKLDDGKHYNEMTAARLLTKTQNEMLKHFPERKKREATTMEEETYRGYVKNYDKRSDSYQWCLKDDFDDCLETLGMENLNMFNFTELLEGSHRSDLSDIKAAFTPESNDISKLGTRPQEFIAGCTFDKKSCSFKDFYMWQSDTYGNCFTFNSPNLYKKGADGTFKKDDYLRSTSRSGFQNGLRMTLNLDTRNYVSLLSPDLGVRVVVHQPYVTPIPEEEGFSVAPGFFTSVGLRMKSIQRIGPPHGNCHPSDWGQIPRKYSQTSCRMLCLEQIIQKKCNCSNAINDLLLAIKSDLPRCNPTNLKQELCRQLEIKLEAERKTCNCPPACDDSFYTPFMSMNQVNKRFFNVIKNKKKYYVGEDVCSDADNTTVRVHVYLESLQQEVITESEAKTVTSVITDIGGNLGLFIGLSLVTLLELLEFVLDLLLWGGRGAACCCCGRKSSMTKTTPVTPIISPKNDDTIPDPAIYHEFRRGRFTNEIEKDEVNLFGSL